MSSRGSCVGKRALVTGGTKGIGAAVVRQLIGHGAQIVSTARSAGGQPRHEREHFLAADLSEPAGAQRIADLVTERMGGVDVVVHNAGGSEVVVGPTTSYTDEDWDRAFALNLLAAVRLDRALVPLVLAQGSGAIVHITSISAAMPTTGPMPVSAAKAALRNYSKSLAAELAPAGIRVNTVQPGFIDTEGNREKMAQIAEPHRTGPEQARQATIKALGGIPMGRVGTPRDVAELVTFLVSRRGSWITGVDYVIDGGTTPSL